MNTLTRSIFTGLLVCLAVAAQTYPASAQTNDEDLYFVAQKAFDDGFYDVSIRYIRQLLDEYPGTNKRIQARLLLGQCYFFQNQYVLAYETFQNLLGHNEFRDASLFWLGETFLKGADYKQAEKHYLELIDLYPESSYYPQALYSLGWLYLTRQDYVEAQRQFALLLNQFQNHSLWEDSLFKLGESFYFQKNFEKSLNIFKDYLERYPKSNKFSEASLYAAESLYYAENVLASIPYYALAEEKSLDFETQLNALLGMGWSYLKLEKFKLARESFEKAREIAEEKDRLSDDVFLGLANLYKEQEEYKLSLDAYIKLISQFPDSPRVAEAIIGKAGNHYLLKQYKLAIRAYEDFLERFEDKAEHAELVEKAYFGLAWAYLKDGDIDTAVSKFKIIQHKTTSQLVKMNALTQIADAYQDAGQLNQAVDVYDKLLKDYPALPYMDYVQYRLGLALLKLDRIDAATLVFHTLRNSYIDSKYLQDVEYYLAVAYFRKSNWKQALNNISTYLSKPHPKKDFLSESSYLKAVSLFQLNEFHEAAGEFKNIIQNHSQELEFFQSAHVYLAKSYDKIGKEREANAYFQMILEKFPGSTSAAETLIWMGDTALESGDLETSIQKYQQFVLSFPDHDQLDPVLFDLGQAYLAKSIPDEAIRTLKQVSRTRSPDLYAKAQLLIAEIFSRQLQEENALDTYLEIIKNVPDFKRDSFVKIAEIHKRDGQFQKALEAYKKAKTAKSPRTQISDAEVEFLVADTYDLLKQYERAIERYLSIPYLFPNDTDWVVKSYLRLARIFEHKEQWEDAEQIYHKLIRMKTREAIYARERLDWIREQYETPVQEAENSGQMEN